MKPHVLSFSIDFALFLTFIALGLEGRPFWTNVETGAEWPHARWGHSAVFRPPDAIVIFGGRADNATGSNLERATYRDDVWQFNTTSRAWEELFPYAFSLTMPTDRPAGRFFHSAVWRVDPLTLQEVMTIYGGHSPLCSDVCDDLWNFDFASRTWSESPSSDWTVRDEGADTGLWPGKLWRHSGVAYEDYMLLYGGSRPWGDTTGEGYRPDIYEFDFDSRTVVRLSPLVTLGVDTSVLPRVSHSAVLDASTASLWVFGGYLSSEADPPGAEFLNDLWRYQHQTNTWTNISVASDWGKRPRGRYGASAFMHDDILAFYGGRGTSDSQFDELWLFNTTDVKWTLFNVSRYAEAGTRPPAQYGHSAVSIGTSVYIFAGTNRNTDFSSLWLLDWGACLNDCSHHGTCVKGWCVCDPGYFSDDCSSVMCSGSTCVYDYGEHREVCIQCTSTQRGVCQNATCACTPPYTGAQCELALCPNDCTPKASVNIGGETIAVASSLVYGRLPGWDYATNGYYANGRCQDDGTCTCMTDDLGDALYTGPDCSLALVCGDPLARNFDPATSSLFPSLVNTGCSYDTPLPVSSFLVRFRLTIDMDFNTFITNASIPPYLATLSDALNVPVGRLVVSELAAGSVSSVLQVLDDDISTGTPRGDGAPRTDAQLKALQGLDNSAVKYGAHVKLVFQYDSLLQPFLEQMSSAGFVIATDLASKPLVQSFPETAEASAAFLAEKLSLAEKLAAVQTATITTTAAQTAGGLGAMWCFVAIWAALVLLRI